MISREWALQGECRGVDPDIFFPSINISENTRVAKDICARCVVAYECLDYALAINGTEGIWGDTTEDERRVIGRRRQNRINDSR